MLRTCDDPNFTENPRQPRPWSPELYHTMFGLMAGIPLCCIVHWYECVILKKSRRHDDDFGLNPLTGQPFAKCQLPAHEWADWVIQLSEEQLFDNHHGHDEAEVEEQP